MRWKLVMHVGCNGDSESVRLWEGTQVILHGATETNSIRQCVVPTALMGSQGPPLVIINITMTCFFMHKYSENVKKSFIYF